MNVETEKESKEEFKYPDVDWDTILPKLPMDEDGYVAAFDIVFDADDEKAREQNKREIYDFFNTYGVVVIRNVLDENEAKLSCDELFDYVEQNFEGLDRNDPNTWHRVGGLAAKLGLITDRPVMSPQIVRNRINRKIYTAYSYILDVDISNLYTNVGRVGWMRPTKNIQFAEGKVEDREQWKTADGRKWVHLDYDPLSNHATTFGLMPRKAVKNAKQDTYAHVRTQAILALDDCSINDGGFQCIPGFHKIMQDVWIKESGTKMIAKGVFQHRYQFKEDDPLIGYVAKCPIRRGSYLIWNNKLPHNNFSNNSNHARKVQYIRYARYDDPATKPVKFGVEQQGPWGMWPLTLQFPFEQVELNEVTKRIYGIDVPDPDGEDAEKTQANGGNNTSQNNNGFKFNCSVL